MSIERPHNFKLGITNCSTHTISQLLDEVQTLLSDKSLQPRTLLCVNAHIFNMAWSDRALLRALNVARLVAADGMSIVWASRLFDARVPERCNMTEAFRAFLQSDIMPANVGVLVGMTDEELKLASNNIEVMSSHCRIINTISGFLHESQYYDMLEMHKDVDFIFLGMGTPKSEKISKIASAACPQAIVWHIGGGTIRIIAGTMREAPLFMRRMGLQWLHRLSRDPVTYWRRYLVGNPLFLYRLLVSRARPGLRA